MYVTYCSSAPTTRLAPWNFVSSGTDGGRSPTMRLCSRANSVWIAVSAMFSFARTSPATTARAGSPTCAPNRSIGGAAAGLPRASSRGR